MESKKRRRSRDRDKEKDEKSIKSKKIRGRGVNHESGLKSWNTFNRTPDKKENSSFSKKSTKTTEEWIADEIKKLETKPKENKKKTSAWVHDKFDKINRSPDSQESETNKIRGSPVYTP